MTIANPTKAFIVLVALVCITVLRAINAIDQASFNGLAGLLVGYAVGNGVQATKKEPVTPIIGPRNDN